MEHKTRTLVLSVAMIVAGGAPLALAQPPGPMPFTVFDQDSDGIVTEQEFNSIRAERMAARAAAGAPMNGAANAPTFADFDSNGDGQLMPDEFAAGQQARMQGRPGMGPGMGAGMGSGQGMGMGRNMPTFTEFDLNADGSLSEQEFYEARANRIAERSKQGYQMRNLANAPAFGEVDLNNDGLVDPQEFATAQAHHRQQMQPPSGQPAPANPNPPRPNQ
ncbi:EF-hand domain-containing protein [Thiorhodovibrio frisius]|uniref:EF-hand domain-containing protein n=1 Tax=Thiorhodovibrio frisius TaxID=631362 RepID=H8Z7F6_9GAMM|nr:hypothetical protein [Thiorhodovibrio frisius]EIC20886.1 hypothetical protein Thi970DRAFT_04555 [Thiorhodovibrio frisius]WPL21941.1 EF hand [Thiorhodovibrio frisius]